MQVTTMCVCFKRGITLLSVNTNSFNFMFHEELVGTLNGFLQALHKQCWYEPCDHYTARLDLSQPKGKLWQEELAGNDSLQHVQIFKGAVVPLVVYLDNKLSEF